MIVFVRTRYEYASYVDYWKLVELSEFPTVYVDEVDIEENVTYIVSPMNGEWRPHIDSEYAQGKEKMARLYLWNLERPGGSGNIGRYKVDNVALIRGDYVDHVLVSDRRLAQMTNLHYVPLGTHAGLGMPGTVKRWDLIHLSCFSGRRSFLFTDPHKSARNVKGMSVAPNGWGQDRHKRLQESKFMLNVHQDDYPFIEPLRFALASAYGLPIITEQSYDLYPYDDHPAVRSASLNQLVSMARQIVQQDYNMWRELGNQLRLTMTSEFQFRQALESHL